LRNIHVTATDARARVDIFAGRGKRETMLKFWVGLVVGLLLIPVGAMLYFVVGHPPVAVADHPFPFEKQIVKIPLHARIDREMPSKSPIEPTAANLTAGAQVYVEDCAFCHGDPGKRSEYGPNMYPHAPQLWEKHGRGVVGVSDDPVGETYWKVANGIRLTGMPSYAQVLNDTQKWQVSLLLKEADQPLPASAEAVLQGTAASSAGR
jgi:mono/diheme cytochrome c family protein